MKEYYDAAEVRESISQKAKTIVQDLFPEIKIKGGEGRIGSLDGEKGNSMAISLNPTKNLSWIDHATGDKGDVFDILQATKGMNYPEAIEWLADTYTACIKRPWEKENLTPKVVLSADKYCTPLTQNVADYMLEVRKIEPEVLFKYDVRSAIAQPNVAAFLHHQAGHLTKVAMSDTESKNFWAASGGGGGLFGSHIVTPDCTKGVLIIAEGQIDALSYAQVGYPAVSIPNGVSNTKWIAEAWEYLQGFHTIKLAYDMDEAGQGALPSIVKRLGVHKCLIVSLPLKDASEMLQAGRGEELREAVEAASPPDNTDIINSSALAEEVYDVLSQDLSLVGDKYFLTGFDMRIRDHELTVVYGRTGHGKTQFCSNQIAYDAAKAIATAVASFEQRASFSMSAMLTQYTGNPSVGDEKDFFMQEYHEMAEYVDIYTKMGRPTPKEMIAQFVYSYKRKGIKRFIIDNLTTLDLGKNDLEDQANAMDLFRMFVNEYPVHLTLVVHPRKENTQYVGQPADRADVKGSSAITDLAHNLILIHKNCTKGDTMYQLLKDERPQAEIDKFDADTPDGLIKVQKHRFLGTEPQMDVWFDKDTKIFMSYRGYPVSMRVMAQSQEPQHVLKAI